MIDLQNLTESTLKQLGIAFSDSAEATTFADFVLEELEVNIGESISEGMSKAVLDEFDAITNQAESKRWLNKNRPDYQDIVKREMTLMVWNLLKYRKEVSTSRKRKEIESVYCHIQVLGLDPETYKSLCKAQLNFIHNILDLDNLESVNGLNETQKNEIKSKIVDFLISKLDT